MKIFLAALILAAIALAGCAQQPPQQVCPQVITPATSPSGQCTEFPTPCDVPKGFTLVEKCEQRPEPAPEPEPEIDLCEGVNCADKCEGTTSLRGGACAEGQCEYANVAENSPECGYVPPELFGKYDFDTNLVFCDYQSPPNKFVLFYQIRNRTENIPTYGSTIWIKVPEIDYAQQKTIQSRYEKDRILWEDKQYTYLSKTYKGQDWEIRNLDSNAALDFQLIYCEPENSTVESCTPQNGVLIHQGNTGILCRSPGQT